MHERNPLQVQFAPVNQRQRRLPLVLIHDGGGTTFTYFLLESLHRDVWAIHNPHYHTGDTWPGGMEQMARHYIGLMLMAGLSGPIMLGVETSNPDLGDIPELVQKCFDNCNGLLDTWKLLPWDKPVCDGRDVCVSVDGEKFRLQNDEVLYKPINDRWQTLETRTFDGVQMPLRQPISPPPGVLIKCVQRVPVKGSTTDPVQVDLDRDEPLLGWEGNHPEFLKAVIEADAHHFNVFQFSNITQVTKQINEGLEVLDSLNVSEPVIYV
ncbi:Polyketide synthase PksR [Colletotrichum truncatum]|uniref:Polyketide synthase PksR n=1 Tax=Colletotrichum truncatum TaxID=5467 RepID=A0ACC3YYF5_COLTU|nr:Polyketide synthase PksR [Colletotrichum truncatum]KAF6782091.1 Polyketide synthase PksR [Colletotrichum truncatum]